MKNTEKEFIENAVIKDVELCFDREILTLNISIEGYGWGITYGNVALDTYNEQTKQREGTIYGTQVLIDLMKAFEVSSLSELKGKSIRVAWWNDEGRSGISRIGDFLKDDSKYWFSFTDTYNKVHSSKDINKDDEKINDKDVIYI